MSTRGYARLWKRNERLVYLTNFLHMTMMTLTMGGVWDIFLYNLSQEQSVFWPAGPSSPIQLGIGASGGLSPAPLRTFSSFELTMDLKPSKQPAFAHPDCGSTFTCGTSIIHITDGAGNGECCKLGNRVPAVFFLNGTTRLMVAMDAPGQSQTGDRRAYDSSQMCLSRLELEPEKWSKVKIKQSGAEQAKGKFDGQDGALVVFINGAKMCEINSTRARQVPPMDNTQLFFGSLMPPLVDPHVPANTQVRNIKYGKPASNIFVGAVNSLQGLVAVALMYPIGWLGDYTNRYTVMRANLLVGFASAAILIVAVVMASPRLLLIGVAIFSCYQQCISSTIYTILSDNVERGGRGRASVNYKTLSALAMSFGPAIQLLVILAGPADDAWTTKSFNTLMLPGWVLMPFVAVAVFAIAPVGARFSSLPNADEGATPRGGGVGASPSSPIEASVRTPAAARPKATEALQESWLDELVTLGLRRRFVVALSAQVFFVGTLLANGMTVRYFSLYYTQVLKFSPAQLCILNMFCRLWIALFVRAVSPLAKLCGRCNLCVVLHILSAVFTLGIYGGGIVDVPPLWLSCTCYFLRYGCLQARDPLLYSITMDIVPESQRSRWAALNSLRTLSFSGSALIGGMLADLYGYEFSFQITVVSLLLSTALFIPAWLHFPRREGGATMVSARSPRLQERAASEATEASEPEPSCAAESGVASRREARTPLVQGVRPG